MPILSYLAYTPEVGAGVGLAEDAYIVGRVRVTGPAVLDASAILRGDQNRIAVGPRFFIGRHSTVHVETHTHTEIGSEVWLGEHVVVHACRLGDGVRVEDGGLVLSTSSVGAGSIVTADSLVPEGADFPDNSYIGGTPGRRLRDTTPDERQETQRRLAEALRAVEQQDSRD